MDAWIAFRRAYGLRFDLDWVVQVAADPRSDTELSVPLLPHEVDAVARRNLAIQQLAPDVDAYGALFPDEFGGSFIDGTRVVARFTAQLAAHAADLKALYGDTAPIDVQAASYSITELQKLAAAIEADKDWFLGIAVTLVQAHVAVLTNGVTVVYRADDTSVEPAIADHLGRPAWLRLERMGGRSWDGPRGSLRVKVVDETGRPLDVTCQITSLDGRVTAELLPREAKNGVCRANGLPAVEWEVRVTFEHEGTTSTEVTRLHVPAGGVGRRTIVIAPS